MDRISASKFREFVQHKPRKRQKTAFVGNGLLVDVKKEPKYHNRKCEYNGIKFDSTKERDRYIFLCSCERSGVIHNLRRQVEIVLIPDEYEEIAVQLKTKVRYEKRRTFIGVRYKADFVYEKGGQTVYEDVKSTKDREKQRAGAVDDAFFLKQKMLHSLLHIDLKIVDSPTENV